MVGSEKLPTLLEGYEEMAKELKQLKTVERFAVIKAIEVARAHGDLSENAEYHAAKEQQGLNESRVAELEETLSRAEIIDISKLSGKSVKFGAVVTVVDEETDDEAVYRIVGELEANVREGRISITSPLARALIGKTVGDSVEVATPGGGKSYQILKVKFK